MATTTRKTPVKYKRGKVPTIRHNDLLDLTTWPLGGWSPTGRAKIAMCPECGRKGERAYYPTADRTSFTHLTQFQTMFWFVRDSCDVKGRA